MKIETFTKISLVVVIFFSLGLLLVGEGILSQQYNVADPPTFNGVSRYNSSILRVAEGMRNETMVKETDPKQQDQDYTTYDSDFIDYARKSYKATSETIRLASSSEGAINEVLQYLKVNSVIIGGIVSFIAISFAFALLAWWLKRRA